MSITKAMGVARKEFRRRQASDFYATPRDCTLALLEAEGERIDAVSAGHVWEPACGDGAIAQVFLDAGYRVRCSDIVDRGYLGTIEDFLQTERAEAHAIITNPPYGARLPERFLRHAVTLRIGYVALFLKSNYFNAAERLSVWQAWPPAAVYPLTWRPDFTGDGAPTMDMTWYVWDVGRVGFPTAFRPLARPADATPRLRYRRPTTAPLLAWADGVQDPGTAA